MVSKISMFDLTGKTALITGGNSGIGLAMATALAQSGADVCIWGRNENKNKDAEEKLKAINSKAVAMQVDVSDEAGTEKAFADTLEIFGRVDAFFANAGTGGKNVRSFMEMSTDEWRRVLSVNLDGAFFGLRAAARHMVERGGGGVIVGTSSLAAISGQARGQHYAASKGALVSMIKALAVELARYGIRAHAILPGWIVTEMTENTIHDEKFISKVMSRVPVRRWGEPADFGGLAVYLASDASAYHTGDTFVIDGGYAVF
jgi:hypothetical protein